MSNTPLLWCTGRMWVVVAGSISPAGTSCTTCGALLTGTPQAVPAPAANAASSAVASKGRRRPVIPPRSCGLDRCQRQLHHETGTPLRHLLDPDAPTVQPRVLGDQRQAEAGPLAGAAPSGTRAPREALEDQLPLLRRHPGPSSST